MVGKAVLVSGHDLHDLAAVLEATAGTGINVYTHGELLPAHGYPELHKHAHLAGNYGGAWLAGPAARLHRVPGPIVMTSNCLIEPQPAYRNRIFTTGPVGWPGIRHVETSDLSLVVKAAQSLPGFTVDVPEETVTTGFARGGALRRRQGDRGGEGRDIKRFLLIGGCDGAARVATTTPMSPTTHQDNTVLMTLGCNKYRFNTHDFGDIGGIPRLLDVGQCNDSYSAIQIALASPTRSTAASTICR